MAWSVASGSVESGRVTPDVSVANRPCQRKAAPPERRRLGGVQEEQRERVVEGEAAELAGGCLASRAEPAVGVRL